MTRPSPVLFLCLFASQAAMLVLSPILPDVAREFGVSTATAGQLRSISGLTGGVTALLLAVAPRRPGLRELLSAGAALVALGSASSAAAPAFFVLALAQGVVGVGVGLLVAVGIAAAGEWPEPDRRPHVLAWAIAGMPAAWITGMPVVGVVADVHWRAAWIAVPTVVALATLALVRMRPADARSGRAGDSGPADARSGRTADSGPADAQTAGAGDSGPADPRSRRAAVSGPADGRSRRSLASAGAWRRPDVARFAAGELLANAAWASVLTYAGALLLGSYPLSPTVVALGLGAMAAAMVPGTFFARRHAAHATPALLIALTGFQGGAVLVLGAVRPAVGVTLGVLAVMAFANGWRSMIASALGMDTAPRTSWP